MQFSVGVYGLGSIKQILHEFAAQVHIHLLKGASAVHKPFEVLVNVLPLGVFPVSQLLEVGKEIAFHPRLVKETVVLVEDGFVALVTQYLRFLHHACVEIPLLLVGRLGEEVDAQGFACNHPHGGVVAVAGIIVQTQRILCPALDFALAQSYSLAFHIHSDLIDNTFVGVSRTFRCKGTT